MIFTADVEPDQVETELDIQGVMIRIVPAYLSQINGDSLTKEISDRIDRGEQLTDEELLSLILLPLSYKTTEKKQEKIKEAVDLSMKITDDEVKNFALSGILVFSDKVIDDNTKNYVRRMIAMTKIGQMFEQEKIEAVEAAKREDKIEFAMNMINANKYSHEEISSLTGLTLDEVKELAGKKAS